jgi:hypothetical protein
MVNSVYIGQKTTNPSLVACLWLLFLVQYGEWFPLPFFPLSPSSLACVMAAEAPRGTRMALTPAAIAA